jgi:hypothetical protein
MPHSFWRHGLSWFSVNRRRAVSQEMLARSMSRIRRGFENLRGVHFHALLVLRRRVLDHLRVG